MPPRVGVGVTKTLLTLAGATEMALRNNLEIEIEKTNTANAIQAIKAARGVFDPVFRFEPGYENRNTPASSVLQGAGGNLSESFATQNFYFRQKTPWYGASFHIDFENSRQATSNTFATLNPLRTSRFLAGVSFPLLRNRNTDAERAEIRIRSRQADISDVDFELRVIDVVARVEQAYWDLVAARQDVQVKADGVEWAREQLARNKRMIGAGTLAPVELAASEAELQRRIDTWLASVGMVTEVENHLKSLLAPGRDSTLWGDQIVPSDVKLMTPPTDELQEAVARALKQRPELRQVGLRLDANDVQKELNANQTKPQVNLIANYWSSGLGGSIRPGENPFSASNAVLYQRLNQLSSIAGLAPIDAPSFDDLPPNLVGGYGTALDNLFAGRYQSVQVGIAFDLNLRNRTAEANLAQSTIAGRRLKLERSRMEQLIQAQVRNSLQALETARQRITAAEASERAAREKLESETRLFQSGESTNFMVLTRQNEYLDSRGRAVVARLEFNRAVSRLEQAIGSTLQTHKINLP